MFLTVSVVQNLHSQNKPALALLIHDIPLRNIVEPLNIHVLKLNRVEMGLTPCCILLH